MCGYGVRLHPCLWSFILSIRLDTTTRGLSHVLSIQGSSTGGGSELAVAFHRWYRHPSYYSINSVRDLHIFRLFLLLGERLGLLPRSRDHGQTPWRRWMRLSMIMQHLKRPKFCAPLSFMRGCAVPSWTKRCELDSWLAL